MKFSEEPVTWEDLILIFPVIVTEIVVAVSGADRQADDRLEDIASRLFDVGKETTNERLGVLIDALAKQLIATEYGA